MGTSHADRAREAYRDDPFVSNEEYGRLVEEADQQDQQDELDAEREPEPAGPFYVHRYEVALQYGGPEEGGWWYTAGDPDPDWQSEKFEDEELANARCYELNVGERDRVKQEEQYEFTSVLAYRSTHYQYDVTTDAVAGSFPEYRPRYE